MHFVNENTFLKYDTTEHFLNITKLLIPQTLNNKTFCVTSTVRATFTNFNLYLVIYMDLLCRLKCVNSFICSLHNIFKFFMKISMNL
jgi:hypothetical protein